MLGLVQEQRGLSAIEKFDPRGKGRGLESGLLYNVSTVAGVEGILEVELQKYQRFVSRVVEKMTDTTGYKFGGSRNSDPELHWKKDPFDRLCLVNLQERLANQPPKDIAHSDWPYASALFSKGALGALLQLEVEQETEEGGNLLP